VVFDSKHGYTADDAFSSFNSKWEPSWDLSTLNEDRVDKLEHSLINLANEVRELACKLVTIQINEDKKENGMTELTAILGLDTDRFYKDLSQIEENIESLTQLGIIKAEDISMILNRVWGTIPKYVTVK